MQTKPGPNPQLPRVGEAFADTRWSLVARVRDDSAAAAERSLGELCNAYWYPVFAYVRRCGHAPETAYGLTQSFFGRLFEELRQTNPQAYGQFRSFLLARLNRFLGDEWRKDTPAVPNVELDAAHPLEELELRQSREHAPEATPERVFQRGFALQVLAHSLERLRGEARQGNRLVMFERLEAFLTSEPQPGQHEVLARELNSRPLAIVVAIKRLRQRFRELVDEELAQTVASDSDLDAERSALLAILGAPR